MLKISNCTNIRERKLDDIVYVYVHNRILLYFIQLNLEFKNFIDEFVVHYVCTCTKIYTHINIS